MSLTHFSRHFGRQFLHIDAGLVIAKFRNRSREVGFIAAVWFTVQQAIRMIKLNLHALDDFDARYGTDTGGTVGMWLFRLNSPNAVHGTNYQSIGEVYTESLLSGCPRTATFVDLGCGKGRPLIVASKMGFQNVTGVEFVEELAAIARMNLRITECNANVVCADAAAYALPSGPLVVYMFNPFHAPVMRVVAEKLRSRKDELWVISVNPKHPELFDAWLERQALVPAQQEVFSTNYPGYPVQPIIWHRPAQA